MSKPAGFAVRLPVLSLRQTMMLGVALGILLPALLLAYFMVTAKLKTEVALRVEAPMRQYAEVLSRGMAVAVWNLDRSVARELVDAVMRNPDVVSVTVTDEFQDVFVHKHNDSLPPGATLSDQRDIVYNGTRVGSLAVEMTAQRIEQEMRQDLLRFALALLLQMTLAFLVIWPLFSRRILTPLLTLREDARRLARGELDVPIAPQRKDEMGELAVALDTMRTDLAALMAERGQKTAALQQELAERERTEEALRVSQTKFAAIFEASPIAMSVSTMDSEVPIVDVNSAWARLFGMERSVAIGSNGERIGVWRDPGVRQEYLNIIDTDGELSNFKAWMLRGSAREEILCDLSGRVVPLGGERVLIMAFEDITATYRYEENILQLNATLEQRVQERTLELSTTLGLLMAAQGELVRAEKMSALGSLVAGIAHELNTPIGNSLTVASTLQYHADTFAKHMGQGLTRTRLEEFVANARQGTDILMRGLQHAAELVASFKQVAVDQTSLNRRSFKLQDMVNEILLTLRPTIRKSHHLVNCDIAPDIVMDSYPGSLGQVLTNLVNNALLHAFEGVAQGSIQISASLMDDATVRLQVSDNGGGIAPEHLPRVFDPFFTTKLGQGGSGLGLHIVYNLVTKSLGGAVHVTSHVGQGTTVSMVLPCVAPVVPFDAPEA